MGVTLRDWKNKIEAKAGDPNVSIRFVGTHQGRALDSPLIPPDGSNIGHRHPEKG